MGKWSISWLMHVEFIDIQAKTFWHMTCVWEPWICVLHAWKCFFKFCNVQFWVKQSPVHFVRFKMGDLCWFSEIVFTTAFAICWAKISAKTLTLCGHFLYEKQKRALLCTYAMNSLSCDSRGHVGSEKSNRIEREKHCFVYYKSSYLKYLQHPFRLRTYLWESSIQLHLRKTSFRE